MNSGSFSYQPIFVWGMWYLYIINLTHKNILKVRILEYFKSSLFYDCLLLLVNFFFPFSSLLFILVLLVFFKYLVIPDLPSRFTIKEHINSLNSWHVSFDIDSKTHLYLSNIKMWENMQYGKNVMIWRRCSSYIFKF